MKIIKLSPQERKIGLSIRALKSDEYRADWEAYQESEGTARQRWATTSATGRSGIGDQVSGSGWSRAQP
jgi:ribosomal protein S1